MSESVSFTAWFAVYDEQYVENKIKRKLLLRSYPLKNTSERAGRITWAFSALALWVSANSALFKIAPGNFTEPLSVRTLPEETVNKLSLTLAD